MAIEAEMMAEGLAIPNETHPDVVCDVANLFSSLGKLSTCFIMAEGPS